MAKQQIEQERNWYVIHTYSGYEDAVAKNLKQRIESLGMEDKIFNVIVPKEKKIKIKNGKRKTVEEKIYPGYVLVEMMLLMNHGMLSETLQGLQDFWEQEQHQFQFQNLEMEDLMKRMEMSEPEFTIDFEIGTTVKVNDGPFKGFEGKVSEIDKERGKIKVLVNMFGRDTPVELDSLQIKKVEGQ